MPVISDSPARSVSLMEDWHATQAWHPIGASTYRPSSLPRFCTDTGGPGRAALCAAGRAAAYSAAVRSAAGADCAVSRLAAGADYDGLYESAGDSRRRQLAGAESEPD